MATVLIFLFIAIYLDISLLKKGDRRLFTETFVLPGIMLILGVLLIFFVFIFSGDRMSDLPSFILLFVLPLYLLKRQQFAIHLKYDSQKPLHLLADAAGVIVKWIYGAMVFNSLLSGILDLYPDSISQMAEIVISAVFSSALIFCLIYYASGRFSDQGFLTNIGLRKGNRPWTKVILIPAALGLLFGFLSSYFTVMRQIQPPTPLTEALATTQSMGLILIFLFLAICTAPLIEEIVFRGYFFRVIGDWIGTRKAVYVIALTFAFLHVGQYWGDWLAIGMVTLLGFTLTLLRAWTGTTIASTITHYVYNASVTIIPIIIIGMTNPPYLEYKMYYPYHDAQTKEDLLKKAIDIQPDLADAYNDLAWLYAQEETNLQMALGLAEQALKFSPQQPAYLDTKAEVLQKLGRTQEAQTIRARLLAE